MTGPMKVYTVRMHEELASLIDEVARERGGDSSAYIREACLAKIKRDKQLERLNLKRKIQRKWRRCKDNSEVQEAISEMVQETTELAEDLETMKKSIPEDCL